MTTTYVPTERAKTLRRFINAHRLWHRKCDELRDAEKSGDPVRFSKALAAWEKGRIPSKRAKHHAYDDAAALARYIAAETGTTLDRANTVDDLAATLEAFNALTGGAR